jgi:flagellar hook protein FlgE
MFAGISGLKAHGERMSVIGNNLSNVNTIGYKSSRMDFEDLIYQDQATANGLAQVGRGVKIGDIMNDFSQGSFETTNESTDMAIGGNGFFWVKDRETEDSFYTRAGNFRFDKEGYLVDPHDLVLQGWEVERQGNPLTGDSRLIRVGDTKDIKLENFQAPAEPTTRMTIITNLDSEADSAVDSTTNPSLAMFNTWDGYNSPDDPLGTSFTHQSTIKVYDDKGSAHEVSVFYDPVPVSNAGGRSVWEYMVAIDPAEDNRVFSTGETMKNTSAAGILMTGTMTYNAAGDLENITGYVPKDGAGALPAGGGGTDGDGKNAAHWELTEFSTNGLPMFVANFLGKPDASFVDSADATTSDVLIELNLGISNDDISTVDAASPGFTIGGWNDPTDAAATDTIADIPAIGGSATITGTEIDDLAQMYDPAKTALTSTSYNSGSTTLFQDQDGYPPGFLQNVTVNGDGVILGRFSNGQELELFQLTLADFVNTNELRREGGNLFTETVASGSAIPGRANEGTKGTILANTIEMSNVDYATEFVNMITTERGFQSNSKVITTVDNMLQTLVMMKR